MFPAGWPGSIPSVTVVRTSTYTLLPEVAFNSSTSISATGLLGIPSWAKKIYIHFNGFSTNGTSPILIQGWNGTSWEVTGYLSAGFSEATGGGVSGVAETIGFVAVSNTAAASLYYGVVTLVLENAAAFRWSIQDGALWSPADAIGYWVVGIKSFSAALSDIRILSFNGTDANDAGALAVAYE